MKNYQRGRERPRSTSRAAEAMELEGNLENYVRSNAEDHDDCAAWVCCWAFCGEAKVNC